MNVAQQVITNLEHEQSRPAITEADGRLISRGQLRRRIQSRAARLTQLGVKPGDRVVVQEVPGIDLAISALAVLVAGGVLVLAEAGMAREVYERRVAKADVSWFLIGRKLRWIHRIPLLADYLRNRGVPLPPLPSRAGRGVLVTPLRGENSVTERTTVEPRAGDSLAAIVFTGGTTSEPRGVCLSQGALQVYLTSIGELLEGRQIESFVADTPQQILYGLYLGVGVWVPRRQGRKRARCIAHCLVRGDAQMYFGPPSAWVDILAVAREEKLPAPGRLQQVMLGGAPVSNQILRRLADWLLPETRVKILYGLTEAGPVCVCPANTRLTWQGEGSLVGRPLRHIGLTLAAVNHDGVGELEVTGPSLFSGYLGEAPAADVLKTGDLARFVELDGCRQLVLMGRTKDMIIRRGVNIYPSAVEPLFRTATDLRGRALFSDCALVGVWDAQAEDERLILFYVLHPDLADDSIPVEECLRALVSHELVPDTLLQLTEIPATGRQRKPDKQALRRLAAAKLKLPPAECQPVLEG